MARAVPLPAVVCQAIDAFRAALDGLGVKHAIQPSGSYTVLAKSRGPLLRELRRAQGACSGSASLIRTDLRFRKNDPTPLVLVTPGYTPPLTTDEMIGRAHAFEHLHAMADWVTSAVAGLEEPADPAMAERFAEEAVRMSKTPPWRAPPIGGG